MKNIEKYDFVGKPKFLSSGESTLQARSNHNEKFINHQIYDRLLSFLENRQIHNIEKKNIFSLELLCALECGKYDLTK